MAALDAMEPEVAPSCYEEGEVPCLPPPAVSPVSTASSSPPPPPLASVSGPPTLPSPGEEYLRLLRRERRTLDSVPGAALSLAHKLITQEMERIQGGGRPPAGGVLEATAGQVGTNQQQHPATTTNHHGQPPGGSGGGGSGGRNSEERRIADITKEKPIKVSVRVLVPAKEHPKFNFVGKLLGPKGNSLKRLQEETMTKMAILGRGSMKDKHKEEELRGSGDPRYSHLNEELHVEVTAFAAPAEAHARIAYALAEIRRFLVPDYNDEIRQEQMREMQLMQSADAIELSSCMEDVGGGGGGTGGGGGERDVCSGGEGVVRGETPQTPPSPPPHQVSPPQAGGGGSSGNKQEGTSRVYMHPTLRGISRSHGIPPPGTVYRASILSRLRPPQARMLMAAAAAAGVAPGPTGQALGAATGAPAPAAPPHPALHPPHHKRGLFPFLARFGGGATAGTGVMSSMIGGEESVLGLYDGYSGGGYNLLEEGLGEEMMEDISQDSMKGAAAAAAVAAAAAAAEFGARGAAEANGTANATGPLVSSSAVQAAAAAASSLLKAERGRFRHDPYGRYAAKLPL